MNHNIRIYSKKNGYSIQDWLHFTFNSVNTINSILHVNF